MTSHSAAKSQQLNTIYSPLNGAHSRCNVRSSSLGHLACNGAHVEPPNVVLRNFVGGSILDPPTFYFTAELASDRKPADLPPGCIVQAGGDRVCQTS